MIELVRTLSGEVRAYALFTACILLASYSFITYYVIPSDAARRAIMECQYDIDDMSYEGYEYCAEAIKSPHRVQLLR